MISSNKKPIIAGIICVIGKALLHTILIIYAIAVTYPMIWLLSASMKTSQEIFEKPWSLPSAFRPDNYITAWVQADIGRYFFNSILVTSASMLLILLTGSMAAYALSRYVFRGRNLIHGLFISGMMFPVFLGIVPLFFLLQKMKLWDTHLGLILVYVAYSLPFTIFILTGFFKSLPYELAEAAMLDGCSQFGIFWRIMLPLAKPGLIAAAIFNFIGVWNEYPLALVILSRNELTTLPLGIANLVSVQNYRADWGALIAGLVIILIPSLIVYLLSQRHITAGLTAGALKD
ncbi:MAG: carbohydrate ABC transporter permease [Armatimonadota bacterium]